MRTFKSRVVPAMALTIARPRRVIRLKRVDLPALARPATMTRGSPAVIAGTTGPALWLNFVGIGSIVAVFGARLILGTAVQKLYPKGASMRGKVHHLVFSAWHSSTRGLIKRLKN